MSSMILDEKGFVFLDAQDRPFWVAMYRGEPWLFCWHANKHWVTERKVTQEEVLNFPRNLTENLHELYHRMHRASAAGSVPQEQEEPADYAFMRLTVTERTLIRELEAASADIVSLLGEDLTLDAETLLDKMTLGELRANYALMRGFLLGLRSRLSTLAKNASVP